MLEPLLLLLSAANGCQHALMKGDAGELLLLLLSLLLLLIRMLNCSTATGAAAATWSAPSVRPAEGHGATLLRLMQALLLLPDDGSACGASAYDDADALPLLAGVALPHRPRKPACPAEDQRLLPASEGLGEPAEDELRLAFLLPQRLLRATLTQHFSTAMPAAFSLRTTLPKTSIVVAGAHCRCDAGLL